MGLHTTLPVTLKGESKRSSTHTTEDPVDVSYDIPMQIVASYTTLPIPQCKVSADLSYDLYSQVDDGMRDGMKLGLGMAYEPEVDQRYWYRSIPLRLGYWYRQLPFEDNNGESIDEHAFTAGLSLPLRNKISRVDLAVQYLQRGSMDTNKLSDNSLMFMFGIIGFDIFSKAPDRTAPRDIPVAEDVQSW
ncbi:hypothetical protein DSECCO2_500970 [anaerobic digester metagenome]